MLLAGWQEGHPACKKTEWWGAGMVICLEWGADLHMAQLMPLPLTVSCFSKIQIGFTFLVPVHPGSPGKRAVKLVCVCVMSVYYQQISNCCRPVSTDWPIDTSSGTSPRTLLGELTPLPDLLASGDGLATHSQEPNHHYQPFGHSETKTPLTTLLFFYTSHTAFTTCHHSCNNLQTLSLRLSSCSLCISLLR